MNLLIIHSFDEVIQTRIIPWGKPD